MYDTFVPISMTTITEDSLPLFAEFLKKTEATRVFLCCVAEIYRPHSMIFTDPQRIRNAISYFRNLGLEVGVWVNTFGHGELLAHQQQVDFGNYTRMEGHDGRTAPVAFCPLDEQFVADFTKGIRQLASLAPDMIMLDDDMRFNLRKKFFDLACFCPKHLAWYYELIGEEIPREQIPEKIFTGGKNKYRDAFLDMMGKTLLDFAAKLRTAVDSVNPKIRLGGSITTAIWDSYGTDVIELSRVLAGNTRPFARIAGAPYHDTNIIPIIEASRQQCAWGNGEIEFFCEGDTYPRPRYNVPSRPLELFDLAMLCDGSSDGMLQYVFDYTHSLTYETGYVKRLIRNMPLRSQAKALFEGKRPVGVQVFDVMHKFRNWVLPETLDPQTVSWIQGKPSKGASAAVLSRNSIPTAFTENGFPVLLLGENARYIQPEQLKHGAILDVTAAEILQDRGIDTGLLEVQEGIFENEYFPKEGETVMHIGKSGKVQIRCNVQPESYLMPGNAPGSYRYENAQGQRFFVMAMRYYTPGNEFVSNYLRSWCRRRQLMDVIPWLCGKPMPAMLPDAPEAYVLTSVGENSMAVAILNISLDEIIEPVIQLDKVYTKVSCVNCQGVLDKDTIRLDTISPYGFAAFEVSLC